MEDQTQTPTPPPPPPKLTPAEEETIKLYVLAVNFRAAKAKEEGAKANRIAIEEQIAALVPGPEIGQKTVAIKDGSKFIVTRGLNYKADLDGVKRAMASSTLPYPIASKTTHQLDVQGYEWFKANHPTLFSHIAQHVSVTPKKVSVVLKPAKEEKP